MSELSAKSDRERFPNFGDWTKNPDWMTNEEVALKQEADKLTLELEKLTVDYKKRIYNVNQGLTENSLLANNGKRRLLTAQGNELLEEVAQAFKELGYSVIIMDEELDVSSPKKEDLRISDPDIKDWEAVVEVRGHAKSGGQSSDLNRLSKFNTFAKGYSAKVSGK